MKGGYFLFNGQFHKEGDSVFTLADLSGRSEGFEETFRAEHNEIIFPIAISEHLIATAESTGLEISSMIGPQGRLLRKDVSRLLNKNKLFLAARIGIQVYRTGEKINCILTAEEVERGYYPLNEPGLLLTFCDVPLSGTYKSQTGFYLADELNKHDLINLNNSGFVSKSLFCSIAYIEKEHVFFAVDSSSPRRCAIMEEIIRSSKEVGLVPQKKENVTPEMLLEANEVFLYDSCQGIYKVLGLEDRRYFSPKTKLIAENLRERAKNGQV